MLLLYLISVAFGAQVVPLLVASHKLVPGIRNHLPKQTVYSAVDATNMIKKLTTQCSSDEYIIINQPGLQYTDMTDAKTDNWRFIRRYAMLASTVVGLPRVDAPLDLAFLQQYIVANCDAEIINVGEFDDDGAVEYYDTRTRVIRIDLMALPSDPEERHFAIQEHDELVRKIIRKLPSPHYTIIFTSDTPTMFHPAPDSVIESFPESFEIFHSIVNDASRENEVERNNNFKKVDPEWIRNKNTNLRYLENKKKNEIHLTNSPLWQKYEKLVMTIGLMVASLFALSTVNLVGTMRGWIEKRVKKD